MHEAIMRPHREAFEEGSQGTMITLLDFDGMPAYCDGRLLTDTLRTTWGFEGFTFSDGDNLNSLIGGWRVAADQVEAGAMALQAARESIILLKNEAGLLPLDKKLPSVAVIGPNADDAIT